MNDYTISNQTENTFNDYIGKDFALNFENINTTVFKNKSINYLKITTTGIMLISSSANVEANIFESSSDAHIYEYSEQYLKPNYNTLDYTDYLKCFDGNSEANEISFQKIEKITGEILSFISLKENWDGFGAYPLERDGAVNALSLVNSLGSDIVGNISDLYPNSHGTISFEWEGNASFLSLEIGNSSFSYYKESNSGTLYYDNLELNGENISALKNNLQIFI